MVENKFKEYSDSIKAILSKDKNLQVTLDPIVLNKVFGFHPQLAFYASFLDKYVYLGKDIYVPLATLMIPKQHNTFIKTLKPIGYSNDFDEFDNDFKRIFKVGGKDLKLIKNIIKIRCEKDKEYLKELLRYLGCDYKRYKHFGIEYEKEPEIKKTAEGGGLMRWIK